MIGRGWRVAGGARPSRSTAGGPRTVAARPCSSSPAYSATSSSIVGNLWSHQGPESAAVATGGRSASSSSAASWVCHATRPARRPPLRLRTAEKGLEGGGESSAAGEEEAEAAEVVSLLPGVVRVQCVQDLPRFDLPLLLGNFRSSTCNAVALSYGGKRYLLAPSASVSYGSQVRVYLPGREKPFPARVAHLGIDCELAAIDLAGDAAATEFWGSLQPYELVGGGGLPHLQQSVGVVSYAEAQPQPRVSPGTVMRTEVITYPSALQRLLGLTVAVSLVKEQLGSAVVDARGRCLGVVFGRTLGVGRSKAAAAGNNSGGGSSDARWGQGRRRIGRRRGRRGQTEASAMVVPVPVIAHFLEDIAAHGRCLGFPTLGIQWKRTEATGLRRYTGMAPEQTGVAIVSINPTAALAAAGAQPMDVLTAVGDAAVGNDGTVAFRGGSESINISYHISQFQVGDTLELTLLRGGQPMQVPLALGVPSRLLPLHLGGRPPQWLVLSGLVLTVLSGPFLEGAFGRGWPVRAPVQLLREWHNHPSNADEQVVVVAECQDMGPGSATDGYERRAVMHQRVVRCNGVPVRNMRHFVLMVAEATAAAEAAAAGSATSSDGASDGAAASGSSESSSPSSSSPSPTSSSTFTADGAVAEDSGDDNDDDRRGSHAEAGPSTVPAAAAPTTDAAAALPVRHAPLTGSGPPLDSQYLLLELSSRMLMVLPLLRARQDTAAILAEYEVAQPVSEDLRPEYEAALRSRLGQGGKGEAGGGAGGGGAKGPRGRGIGGARPRAAEPGSGRG